MQINGPSASQNISQLPPVRGPVKPAHLHILAASRSVDSSDELTISAAATDQVDAAAASSSASRASRVAEIRAQLAEGSYETPEKLRVAVDRLFERIG
jgi:hypothetical protein